MRRSVYSKIAGFGSGASNTPNNNPLTYCLTDTVDNGFLHGGIGLTMSGANSRNCQAFMSDYCSTEWDGICEYASQNTGRIYPNSIQNCGSCSDVEMRNMTAGDVLLNNTARKKYVSNMGGNCGIKFEPFDPTVAESPMVGFFSGSCGTQGNNMCVPEYEVNPATIDNDPVMNKILMNPRVAWNILVNIYNTAVNKGSINKLKGTKIYNLFQTVEFQTYIKQTQIMASQAFGPSNSIRRGVRYR